MNDVVGKVREAVLSGVSSTEMEEMARAEVAQEMLDEDRVLGDDEVLEIAEDVVSEESMVDPEDTIDGEEASMTKPEFDNLPPDVRVKDTDGDDAVIVGSRVYKVRIRESDMAERIARSITADMHGAFGIAAHGASYSSYGSAMRMADTSCPHCLSGNTTVVWYDGDSSVVLCNDCGHEFECSAEAPQTVEEATMDEVQLADELGYSLFGTVFFGKGRGWVFQIWENGEVIIEGETDDPSEVYELFDSYSSFEDEIKEGMAVVGSNGKRKAVGSVRGRNVEIGGEEYSAISVLAARMMGYLSLDASDVYDDPVLPGDVYADQNGDTVQVEETSNGDVMYIEDVYDETTACRRMSYRCATRQQFLSLIDNGGYSLRV